MRAPTNYDVAIVGGCGHVGLPLGVSLAASGLKVSLYDIDQAAVDLVNGGDMPFMEAGADEVLTAVLDEGLLDATTNVEVLSNADTVIVVIGTPVDGHLNPNPAIVTKAIESFVDQLRDGQLVILRSTVYPGVTGLVEALLAKHNLDADVAFCPERIAEGAAMTELREHPQIVATRSDAARERSAKLFGRLTDKIVVLEPEEAELAKLFTNTWRYIKFATANQLYMIANDHGLDFETIRSAMAEDYPRAADLPRAGFSAGPCLFKDTMQLASFQQGFSLGHAAMSINEGLPLYVVSRLKSQYDLGSMTVGILGMAFKAESDDTRSSLSYKLMQILEVEAAEVLITDPYVRGDDRLLPLDDVLERSDLLIVGAPHDRYRSIDTTKPVADVWNVLGGGVEV